MSASQVNEIAGKNLGIGMGERMAAEPELAPKATAPAVGSATSDPVVITADVPTTPGDWFITTAVTFVLVHYLLWGPIAGAILFLLAFFGGLIGRAVAVAAFLAYLPTFLDRRERRLTSNWDAFRTAGFWRYPFRYAEMTLIRTHALDPAKQYVMGWHPHGILILSRISVYGGYFEKLFPGLDLRTLAATPAFYLPGSREITLWLGGVDASPSVANSVLAKGKSVIVYPGGSKEIFTTDRESSVTTFVLADRKGFVKLAMRHGASLVPVCVFNERKAFTRIDPPAWLRSFGLRALRTPLLLIYGRWCSLMPAAGLKMGVVFGAPMDLPRTPEPTPEELDRVHAQYVAAVSALWHAHKGRFGYGPGETLVIK